MKELRGGVIPLRGQSDDEENVDAIFDGAVLASDMIAALRKELDKATR